MRRTIELSQSDIIDALRCKYGIRFASVVTFFIDPHGKSNTKSGMPVSGTISAVSVDNCQ